MTDTHEEITSQPGVWQRSLALTPEARRELAAPGERMLLLGCGTSWFVAQAIAELRESAGLGETDAVCASEYVPRRHYDRVVAVTRSGTTTEVLQALRQVPAGTRRIAITAVTGEPVDDLTDARLLLDFADERSVVQTRFPTSVLVLARAAFGDDVEGVVADGRAALGKELPVDPAGIDHLVFLGTGWTVGLAHEAALKVREAAQAYSESYPAKDFRHGPVAVAGPRSLIWSFGAVPAELDDVARAAGATAYRDALAQLVVAQRFALALAAHRGLDPDRPRLLTRSVVLTV
jgi:glucosamine--fructose-6-phosphate aminotransferase (isomerizing)